MRILHFYKTYFPDTVGGCEQVINQLVRGCSELGHSADVLALTPSKEERVLDLGGHTVYQCRSNFEVASTPFSMAAFSRFKQLAKKADIIHFHFPYPFADILHLISCVNRPTVVTYHSDIIKQKQLLKLYRPLKRKFLSSVDHIVATSPNYMASSKVLSDMVDKVSVIPLGIDKATYVLASEGRLNYWQQKVGSKFFLFIGVLRYYKGLHTLLEASRYSDYPIVIVGSGPIENELKQQTIELGLTNIYFVGFLPEEDKVALLELCYAVVFPSHLRSEAFGVALLEGAMYGKPLISCEIGTGTTFVNIDNETGLVVPPSDPAAFRQAMDHLWNNTEQAKKMGQRAEERYWEMFTAKQMSISYVSLYEKLISAGSGSEFGH